MSEIVGIRPQVDYTKYSKVACGCSLSTKHYVNEKLSDDWSTQGQNNVSEWVYIYFASSCLTEAEKMNKV